MKCGLPMSNARHIGKYNTRLQHASMAQWPKARKNSNFKYVFGWLHDYLKDKTKKR